MSSAAETFSAQREQYFDPMMEALCLTKSGGEEQAMFGFIEAAGANVAVRFEHDRGLCAFSVRSTADTSRHWGVSVIAALFPRVRLISGGEQRLSLDEQAHLLQMRWAELERLFAPEQLAATLTRLQAEVDRSLTKFGMGPAK